MVDPGLVHRDQVRDRPVTLLVMPARIGLPMVRSLDASRTASNRDAARHLATARTGAPPVILTACKPSESHTGSAGRLLAQFQWRTNERVHANPGGGTTHG